MDITIRWWPGHHWVRPFISFTGRCDPGHAWLYHGVIRRDAWRIGRLGFGLLRMPHDTRYLPATDTTDEQPT